MSRPADPYRNYKFRVFIDGAVIGGFKTVSGLNVEHDVIEYREGGDPTTPRQIPGQTKYEPISLERGKADDNYFNDWSKQIYDHNRGFIQPPDNDFRRTLTVTLYSKSGVPVKSWRIFHCWVKRIEHSDLEATDSELLYERVEIAHEGIVELDF